MRARSRGPPHEISIDFIHAGGDDDDVTVTAARRIIDELLTPAGFSTQYYRDPKALSELLADYDRQLTENQSRTTRDLPSRILILVDAARMPTLRRSADPLTRTAAGDGEKLRRLLSEGPLVGLHVSIVSSALSLLAQIIDRRRDLSLFSHRVGLQMSQNDSFELFGNYRASTLQSEGLLAALYVNMETSDFFRFKPYLAQFDDSQARDAARKLIESDELEAVP